MAINFGLANDYNVFVFGNLSLSNTDAEGRVAVGGNAVLSNYGVGAGITPLPPAGTDPSFVVGGAINVSGGSKRQRQHRHQPHQHGDQLHHGQPQRRPDHRYAH